MSNSCLFLHWGPGGNASIERLWFGDLLPVVWWDQPLTFSSDGSAFGELVSAAELKLQELAARSGAPVRVLAHSFGGQVAVELARRMPALICDMTLLAGGTNPVRSFVHLAEVIAGRIEATRSEQSAQLRKEAREVVEKCDSGTFWPLIQTITSLPDFGSYYWHDRQALERYASLLPRSIPVDMVAFSRLMSEFVARGLHSIPEPCLTEIPVVIVLGTADPLQIALEEESAWKRVFPRAKIVKLYSGHFLHLERSVSEWWVP